MKRFIDTILVLATAPLWLPLAAAVAAAIAATDGRPVLFSQERSGFRGRPFRLFKFRTMREGEGGDMERTTRLGRFLRATSLDELPQLFHVLSGKMALVGPRPLPVRYLERYSPFQRKRLDVRPGITGLAQINGRNAISWTRKFRLDVYYAERRTLALDAAIILSTFARVLSRSGIDNSADATMPEFTGDQTTGSRGAGYRE